MVFNDVLCESDHDETQWGVPLLSISFDVLSEIFCYILLYFVILSKIRFPDNI